MKKLLSFFMAIAMMASMSICAFAATPVSDGEQASGQIIPIDEVSPRLIPTTKDLYLNTTSWTRLYSDTNWLTEIATIQNLRGNPGSIYVRVTKTVNGKEYNVVSSSTEIPVGTSYATPDLSTSWDKYTIYVKAVDSAGTYSIKYSD